MPSYTHDEFCELIKSAYQTRIAVFTRDHDHPAHAAAIHIRGRLEREFDLKNGGRARADVAFSYRRRDVLVIEVGLSQTSRDLKKKARMWLGTKGITTVITFNLPYQNPEERRAQLQLRPSEQYPLEQDDPKQDELQQDDSSSATREATYTVHRISNTVDDEWELTKVHGTFRDKAGATEGNLQLTLNDFLPQSHALDIDSRMAINIPHVDLDQFFTEALEYQAEHDRPNQTKVSKGRKKCLEMEENRVP